MRARRLQLSRNPEEETAAAALVRSYLIQEERKGPTPKTGVEISRELLSQFENDPDLVPKLFDDIPRDKVRFIVEECAAILGGKQMTVAHWGAVTHFLRGELPEFREMKVELIAAERKLVLVSQRLNEATNPDQGEVGKARVMACAMIFGETEMRRDQLKARILVIIGGLTERIAALLKAKGMGEELEIRLHGVFGNL